MQGALSDAARGDEPGGPGENEFDCDWVCVVLCPGPQGGSVGAPGAIVADVGAGEELLDGVKHARKYLFTRVFARQFGRWRAECRADGERR